MSHPLDPYLPELSDALQRAFSTMQATGGALYVWTGNRLELIIQQGDFSATSLSLPAEGFDSYQTAQGNTLLLGSLKDKNDVLGLLALQMASPPTPESLNFCQTWLWPHFSLYLRHYNTQNMFSQAQTRLTQEEIRLRKIYEAIANLEAPQGIPAYLRLVASVYQSFGWWGIRFHLYKNRLEGLEAGHNPFWVGQGLEAIPPPPPLQDWYPYLQNHAILLEDCFFLSDWHGYPLVFIPMRNPGGELSLTIELYDTPHCPMPDPNTVQNLLILARSLTSALERVSLVSSLRNTATLLSEQIEELEFIRKADREISSRLDPNRIVNFTLDWALRRTLADAGAILVIDPQTNELVEREALGFPNNVLKTMKTTMIGIVRRCMQERKTQNVGDVLLDPDYHPILPNTRSQLAVPLISYRRVVGVLTLESQRLNHFDAYSVSFVERFASMTAVALDNAQLLQQAEQLADDMSLIYNAGRTISASLEWEQAVQSIAQGLALAVKNANALIYAYEAAPAQTAKLLSYYTVKNDDANLQALPSIGSRLPIENLPNLQKALHAQKSFLIPANAPDSPEKRWLEEMGAKVANFIPLIAQGNLVGLAVLVKIQPDAVFASSEIFVAESLATQAAAVMRQATLYSEVSQLEILKSQMIKMAAHDIRAPIANVGGYLGLLESDIQGFITEDIQFFLQSIRSSLKTMENLVEDLLTLEKIDGQRGEAWEVFDFKALTEEVYQALQSGASLKNQTLRFEPSMQEALWVRGNPAHLRQCISNLVGNGIKYTPENGEIVIRLEKNGERLNFSTQDNGYGIPQNRQAKIFQPFYRAKTPGTEHISGTGLGLSLVKSIIERHGGKIWFESQEGLGSTFSFWLPLAAQPDSK